MKNTTWTVIALLVLVNFLLLDAAANQSWYAVREILGIDALILAMYGIKWIVYRKNRGKNENC